MSFQVTILPHGSICSFKGVLSLSELEGVTAGLHADKRLKGHSFGVLDFSDADLSEISSTDIRHPAALDKAVAMHVPYLRVGFVSGKRGTVELCKAYIESSKKFGSTWEYKIFGHLDEAINWGEKK